MVAYSLKKRYVAKLSTNLVGLAIGMVTQAIIPRGLGPAAYGDFNFLTSFFNELMPFFSLSTSTAFYTKLSQRQNEFGLVSFYFQFTCLVFAGLFLFVGLSHALGLSSAFWVDQNLRYVYMAAFWVALTWVVQLMTNVADAYGLTVSTEIARIAQKVIGFVLILFLFLTNALDLTNFFLYHYIICSLLIVLFVWIIQRDRGFLSQSWRVKKEQVRAYMKEFYEYSHPLFVYALIGMVVGILDRWMLQKFAGSVQQGFFGLSYQIGAICFLFTSAMTALITREFSIAYANNDLKEMAGLFRRYIPLLYSIAAFVGCFACAQADRITYILGGSKFAGAALPVSIMALYPIHQTYGQLSGSVFYATGQTGLYRNIGIVFMVIGLPVTYLMIAPSNHMGLDAGATGLAIKYLVFQFIGVNAQLWFNARFLQLRFWKYVGHQVFCIACLLSAAMIVRLIIEGIPAFQDEVIVSFLISGIFYSLVVVALGYCFPMIFGLRREDAKAIVGSVWARIKKN